MGLKCETRYSCYFYPQRDSLIVSSIMEEILIQSMMSVTVCAGRNVAANVFVTVCDGRRGRCR